tara:strand:- start:72 stop:1199 length:1128 start_codon:yes stop_codon:yes gene_type:complete
MASTTPLNELKLRKGKSLGDDVRTWSNAPNPRKIIDGVWEQYTKNSLAEATRPDTQNVVNWLGTAPVDWNIVSQPSETRENSTLQYMTIMDKHFGQTTSRGTNVLVKYMLIVKASENYSHKKFKAAQTKLLDLTSAAAYSAVDPITGENLFTKAGDNMAAALKRQPEYDDKHKKVVNSFKACIFEYADKGSHTKCSAINSGGFGELPTDPSKIAALVVEFEHIGKWTLAVANASQKIITNWNDTPLVADTSDPYNFKAAEEIVILFQCDKIPARFKDFEKSKQVYEAALDCMSKTRDEYITKSNEFMKTATNLKNAMSLKRKRDADPDNPVLDGDANEDELGEEEDHTNGDDDNEDDDNSFSDSERDDPTYADNE